MKVELIKINPEEFGLKATEAKTVEKAFQPMLKKMNELEDDFNKIISSEINPETILLARSLRLKIAEKDNKWTFGYSYNYNNKGQGGCSSPCSFFEWNSYLSKSEAIQEAIKQLRGLQYWQKGNSCEWHLEEINKFEASLNQLTLF